jgi:hypothetical protein
MTTRLRWQLSYGVRISAIASVGTLQLATAHTTARVWGERYSSCVEEIWKCFKEKVFESFDRFVPHKILRKIPDTEYYNKEVKRLKVKVRRV